MRNLITFDTGDMSYHLEIPYAYPNVITGGSRGRVLEIAKYLANAEVFENKDRGKAVVNGFYFGMPVTAFSTGEGTGGVSCTWPEVIEAIEDDDINFIRIGTSGGIDPHLRVGDLVVTTKVEKKDATSDAVIAFLLEMNELWHAGELGDYPGAAKVYQRLNELYGSPKDFEDRIFSRNYGGYINPRTRSFLPMVPREIYETIEQSAIDTKIEGQKVYKGFTQVTPEIYLNNILESIRPTKGSIAVSMEISALLAYALCYNLIDGRDIKGGNLLMISDTIGENDNMAEFQKNKHRYEEAHIISGLESLSRMLKY